MIGRLPKRHSLGIARALLSLAPVFWGLVLLGLAMWLLRSQEPAAALPCLIFSAGYFWFAWSLFWDSAWEKAKAHRHLEEPPVLEPRTHSSPGGAKLDVVRLDRRMRPAQERRGLQRSRVDASSLVKSPHAPANRRK